MTEKENLTEVNEETVQEALQELSPKDIESILRENNLTLTAHISNGRFICRVTDASRKLIAGTSCKSLNEAAIQAVRTAKAELQ